MKQRIAPVHVHRSLSAIASILKQSIYPNRVTFSMPNLSHLCRIRTPDTAKDRQTITMAFNTLSVITTPWNTDSLCSIRSVESETATTYILNSLSNSTFTVNPKSTTSLGMGSSTMGSKITLTSVPPGLDISTSPAPMTRATRTLSSWTLETLTSSELLPIKPRVKVKYPWSPTSSISCSDCYPSSLTTLASKGRPMTPEISSSLLVLPHALTFLRPGNETLKSPNINLAILEEKLPYVNIINTTV